MTRQNRCNASYGKPELISSGRFYKYFNIVPFFKKNIESSVLFCYEVALFIYVI